MTDAQNTAREALDDVKENCRMAYRAAEMSAEIMRDARRTGDWEGSERTARAFDRIAKNAKAAHDGLCALSAAQAPPAAPGTSWTDIGAIADLIVRDVCEMPDRTSPDDWPEAMLVTGEELYALIVERFGESTLNAAHPPQISEQVEGVRAERLEATLRYIADYAKDADVASYAAEALAALSRGEGASRPLFGEPDVAVRAQGLVHALLLAVQLGEITREQVLAEFGPAHHPEAGVPSREAAPDFASNADIVRRFNAWSPTAAPPALKASDLEREDIEAALGEVLVEESGNSAIPWSMIEVAAHAVFDLISSRPAAPEDHSSVGIKPSPTGEIGGGSDEALKPCPFCGSDAERIDIDEGENAGGSCISCTSCRASSNVEFGFKENFVANWNRRFAPLCETCGDHAEFERDHADTPPHERPDWPLPSFDAMDWAKAFCTIAGRLGYSDAAGKPVDEQWMVGWFANALMRGFDEHAARVAQQARATAGGES